LLGANAATRPRKLGTGTTIRLDFDANAAACPRKLRTGTAIGLDFNVVVHHEVVLL